MLDKSLDKSLDKYVEVFSLLVAWLHGFGFRYQWLGRIPATVCKGHTHTHTHAMCGGSRASRHEWVPSPRINSAYHGSHGSSHDLELNTTLNLSCSETCVLITIRPRE